MSEDAETRFEVATLQRQLDEAKADAERAEAVLHSQMIEDGCLECGHYGRFAWLSGCIQCELDTAHSQNAALRQALLKLVVAARGVDEERLIAACDEPEMLLGIDVVQAAEAALASPARTEPTTVTE